MADIYGSGAASGAAKALRKRKMHTEEATTEQSSTSNNSLPKQTVRDASKGAYKDHQMAQALKMMREKKSTNRADYE